MGFAGLGVSLRGEGFCWPGYRPAAGTKGRKLGGFAMITVLIVIAVLLLRVCIAAALSVCLRERDESGGVLRLGTVRTPARGPGLSPLRPVVDRIAKSNGQVLTVSVPAQDRIAKDDVPIGVDAVVSFRVAGAGRAAVNGQDYQSSVSQLARSSLHSVLGRAELDDLLSSRENLRPELTEIVDAPSEQPTRVMLHKTACYTSPGPVGPQDAPPGQPWDASRGLQDAPGGPQDAAQAETSIEQVEESVESLETLILGNLELLAVRVRDAFGLSNPSSGSCSRASVTGKRVVVGWGAMIAVARSGGAAGALQEFAVGRRVQLVVRGRVDASAVPGGDLTPQRAADVDRTILDALPRPVAGPAYFGGREDAGYFRGWDDGVDGIRRGDQATGPSWGSAAYMTGWRDAVRASERARRG